MKILISPRAGFCFGVQRALKMAYKTLEKAPKRLSQRMPVYTLGPLVHNPQVVERLRSDGIISIDNLSKAKKGFLLIRTHGVPPAIIKKAKRKGLKLIDATCPLVKKIHQIVEKLRKENYHIIIIGHANHPEIKGIIGHVGTDYTVIEKMSDIKKIKKNKKVGVVVQTTFLLDNFRKIAVGLLEKCDEYRVFNTICLETELRQKDALELSKKVEVMIVAGGKQSSNTRRLAEISSGSGTVTYLVETAKDLKNSWFRSKKMIGLTAGASTPDWIIKEVVESIKKQT